MKRRIRSPRASVYLEYAIVMPLVVMMISALIEFSSIWDAKIMANHAAWTVGRIATVRPKMAFSEKLSEKLDSGVTDDSMNAYMKELLAPINSVMKGVNRLNNCGNVATLLLMSTCVNGYWGQSVSADLKSMLEKMLKGPLELLRKNLTNWMTEAITKGISKILPDDIAGPVGKLIIGILTDIIKNVVFEPLSKLVDGIVGTLFPSGFFDWIQGLLEKNRTVRGIFYAATRIAKCDVVTVEELTTSPFAFSSNIDGWGNSRRLSFPRCLDKNITIPDKINHVETDSPWPPNAQVQPMYKIKVAWPYERTWLFPIVSGYESVPTEDGLAKPAAVGYSLVYSQPDIANTNLLAEGAEVFVDGTQTNQFADVLKNIKQEIEGFMKTVAFGMRYRRAEETVTPYDADDKWTNSHKGLGNGGRHHNDGLVFWMGRAPLREKAKEYGEWEARNDASPSYNKSWTVRANGAKQTAVYHHALTTSALLDNLERLDRTRTTLWWFWTLDSYPSDSEFRRRYTSTWYGKDCVQGWWHDRTMTNFEEFKNRVYPWEGYGSTFAPSNPPFANHILNPVEYFGTSFNAKYGVTYDQYSSVAKQIPMSMPSWLKTYEPDNAALWAREEAYAYTNVVLKARFDRILKLVSDCVRDLERQKEGEMPEDVDGQLDWGTSEEEMWKEPKKAAEKIREKLNIMKKENFRLLQEIDDAIDEIYRTWPIANNAVLAAYRARSALLLGFHEKLTQNIRDSQNVADQKVADVGKIREMLKGQRGDTTAYYSTFAKAEAALKDVAAALERAWQAEVAYGKLFKLGPARRAGDKSLDDLDPGKGDDPFDPNIPPESGPQTGTDDDWGGESWTRGAPGKGWKQ